MTTQPNQEANARCKSCKSLILTAAPGEMDYCLSCQGSTPNQDDVAAFMKLHGFHYLEDEDHYWHHQTRMIVTGSQAQFWYTTLQQSNRQLLEEVERSVIGSDETNEEANGLLPDRADRRNQLRAEQRDKVRAIKERRGL